MFNNEDVILLACISYLSDTTELSEKEIFDLLSQEQKDRLDSFSKFAEANMDDDNIEEQCKNQFLDLIKTL